MTREKAVDLVMNAQQGAAEGLGAGSTPRARCQGAKTARRDGRGRRHSAWGCPVRHVGVFGNTAAGAAAGGN
jgi:hypothetical protein